MNKILNILQMKYNPKLCNFKLVLVIWYSSTLYYYMQVFMCFVHGVSFCIFVCASVGFKFLFSFKWMITLVFGYDVPFMVFSCYVLHVMTTIVLGIDIEVLHKTLQLTIDIEWLSEKVRIHVKSIIHGMPCVK